MTNLSRYTRTVALVTTLALTGAVVMPAIAQGGTALISKSSANVKGNAASSEPSISGTGRYVAFDSYASNLVSGDTNGVSDCFVRDQGSGVTERVSVSSGVQSNGACWGPAISQDGRWVAFTSRATNLAGSTNGEWQIYLHNRDTGATRLVSRRSIGGQGGNNESSDPGISKDGRFVVYESAATNLISNDKNGVKDVFLYDRTTGKNKRVSINTKSGKAGNGGSIDPAISADGKFIVYTSYARNLVNGDTNGKRDVFMYIPAKKKTLRVSIRANGKQANGASWNGVVSGNGRYVAYESKARNLVSADTSGDRDVFVFDRWQKKVQQVSKTSGGKQAKGDSGDPTISNNGRWIAFESNAGNLASGDTNKRWDSFVRDRKKGKTKIVSKRSDWKIAWGGDQDDPFISGDGKYVAFESTSKKMVPADQDKLEDIFRRGALY